MFDDLEGRFEHMESLEMRALSDELARTERAQVHLADRFRAAVARPLRLHLDGGLTVEGLLEDSGEDWVRLRPPAEPGPAIVLLDRIVLVEGLRQRARPRSESLAQRPRSLGAVLRGIARDRSLVRLHTRIGSCHGRLRGVGADALDVRTSPTGESTRLPGGQDIVLPLGGLLVVQVL